MDMLDTMFCPSSQWWMVLPVASLRYGGKQQLSRLCGRWVEIYGAHYIAVTPKWLPNSLSGTPLTSLLRGDVPGEQVGALLARSQCILLGKGELSMVSFQKIGQDRVLHSVLLARRRESQCGLILIPGGMGIFGWADALLARNGIQLVVPSFCEKEQEQAIP